MRDPSVSKQMASRIALRRIGTLNDCANALQLLTTDLSSYVTGQCIVVDGGAALLS